MADEATIQALLAALENDDLQVRLGAIVQLGELKLVEAIPRLIELLRDDNELVRMAAMTALGDIGHISALRAVMEVGREAEPPMSILAEIASGKILGSAGEPEPKASAPPVSAGPPYDENDEEPERAGSMEPDDEEDAFAEAPPPAPAPAAIPQPRPAPPRQSSDEQTRRSREEASPPEPVQFSAYYVREIKPDDWQPLQAYVFKESAADRVLEDAEKQLGPLDRFRRMVEGARQLIREGDTITATPNVPGFQFNPPSASIHFFEDWHRFDFKMRAKDAALNVAANGFLTFTVNGVIVADIPLSIFVTHEVAEPQPQPTPPRPIYDTVFASYSRKDTAVVLKVEAAAKSFGMTYLRDVISLRSGENWSAGLEKMIEDATIFQMFWSPSYAVSEHCKREWEYAVGLKKESLHFIRPVYWQQPMPDPPAPLQHLHFTYQPDLVK